MIGFIETLNAKRLFFISKGEKDKAKFQLMFADIFVGTNDKEQQYTLSHQTLSHPFLNTQLKKIVAANACA